MPTRPKRKNLTTDEQKELGRLRLTPGFQVLNQDELPSIFPESLRKKIDSALLIAAPTPTGGTYLAFSANRVDIKDKAIDIEPIGLIVHATGASNCAVFLHHGDWPGRSEKPPAKFWDDVSRSGIGDSYLTNPPRGLRAGTLDQLPKGHRGAFDAIKSEIRASVDGRKK